MRGLEEGEVARLGRGREEERGHGLREGESELRALLQRTRESLLKII